MVDKVYAENLVRAVTGVQGLEKVAVPDLEMTLGVLAQWLAKPACLPQVMMEGNLPALQDAAYWRHQVVVQLNQYIAERKAPKDKTTKTE